MIIKILRKTIVVFICHALFFMPLLNAAQLSLPSGDLIAPEIFQATYVDSITNGNDYKVSVKVTDNMGVKQVVLYYRVIGTEKYQRKLMHKVNKSDSYQTIVYAKKITPPGIEYYVQAMDYAGNTILHGYSFSPLSVKTKGVNTTVAVADTRIPKPSDDDDSIFTNKWFWIGVGVLVAGAAAGGGGGGGGSEPTTTLIIDAAEPIN